MNAPSVCPHARCAVLFARGRIYLLGLIVIRWALGTTGNTLND